MPSTHVHVLGRSFRAFHVCGVVGFAAGLCLSTWLVRREGLSLGVLAWITAIAVCVFLLHVVVVKLFAGYERLVYYHHEVAIFAAVAGALRLAGQPVRPYLDVACVALGTFLACGRLGCMMAGCCYGKPTRRGIRYGAGYVAEGLPAAYVDVPLVAVQAIEAAAVSAIVVGCVVLCHSGQAFVWYAGAYAIARFVLEFVRGDSRPELCGISEAQWMSIAALLGVALALWSVWLALIAVLLLGGAVCCRGPKLFRSRHLAELAAALDEAFRRPFHVCTTSLGMAASASPLNDGKVLVAVSSPEVPLSRTAERRVRRFLLALRRYPKCETLRGGPLVFYLLREGQRW